MNVNAWLQLEKELLAKGEDENLPVLERIHALTELFFHYGQDRHRAAKAVRMIQDLSAPA
jgi:hypothetical protein